MVADYFGRTPAFVCVAPDPDSELNPVLLLQPIATDGPDPRMCGPA